MSYRPRMEPLDTRSSPSPHQAPAKALIVENPPDLDHIDYGPDPAGTDHGGRVRGRQRGTVGRAREGSGRHDTGDRSSNGARSVTRAVVYRRQSFDRFKDELGIDRQLTACEGVAKSRGYTITEVLTDNSTSARKRDRQGYSRLRELMRTGQVDVVLILRIDRLMRLSDELQELIDIVEQNPVKIVTVEGDIDLMTPHGRMMARILVSVAQAEIEVKGERHRLANAQKASQGIPYVTRRPYAYNKDGMTLYEPEASVLRTFHEMLMQGQGFKHCAWWANENGHTTSMGNPWVAVKIRKLFLNKRYAGIREYKGAEYPGTWQPVFSREEWESVQVAIQAKRAAHPNARPRARSYLLTGLLICGECGKYLNGTTKVDNKAVGRNRKVYYCRPQGDERKKHGCGKISRNAPALEEWIRQCVIYRLDSVDLASALSQNQGDQASLKALVDSRTTQQHKLNELVDAFADGILDKDEYSRARTRVLAALDETDKAIQKAVGPTRMLSLEPGQTIASAWETRDNDFRRTLIGHLISEVTVRRGNTKPYFLLQDGTRCRFDPSLIDITWKV